MLGRCTFEKPPKGSAGQDGKGEYRAPKASFTAGRHVWLTRLNNLRIIIDGTTRPLNEAERQVALPLPYLQAGDLTYKQLGSASSKRATSTKRDSNSQACPIPFNAPAKRKSKTRKLPYSPNSPLGKHCTKH